VNHKLVRTDADVTRGIKALSLADPNLARAAEICGPVAVRRKEQGFGALFSAIIGQQVSVASASAIWTRLEAAGLDQRAAVAVSCEDDLRACGLSRQKIRYGLELARSSVDFEALPDLPDDQVIATLVAVPGIGRWTAEVYAMFALGRGDIFAAGDLALQEAVRVLYDLPERPKEKALRERADAWRPHRTVAATLLWAYYARVKSREGVV